ncbi:MAG: 4Fe-4S binding protein [Candidatus Hydrogenedentes bacterium]|nr:4Fe-4S binding protein [Candidatus Hydrogenedentota bacterium]
MLTKKTLNLKYSKQKYSTKIEKVNKNILIVSIGLFSLSTQSILIRDFLNTLEANELTIGLFFASWFFWIFPGAVTSRWFKSKVNIFPLLTLLYIPSWIIGHLLISNAHRIYETPIYETFPISGILIFAFLAPSAVSFLTGLLFPLANLWYEQNQKGNPEILLQTSSPNIVRQVYALEALGSVIGGLITTLSIYLGLSLWIPFLVSTWLIIFSVGLQKHGYLVKIILILLLPFIPILSNYIDKLENGLTWEKAIQSGKWERKIITQQAEYLIGEKNNQITVLKNKKPFLSFPNDDYGLTLTATILSQKEDIRTIVLIGERFIYTIPFLAKIDELEKIIWLPTDFQIGQELLNQVTKKNSIETSKVFLQKIEPTKFLSSTDEKYDAIIVYTGDPTTISSSRYTTQSFFEKLKSHLTEKGIIGFAITGGENFLGTELSIYGASIFYTISTVFSTLAIKPGEESFIFASDEFPMSEHIPTLETRLSKFLQNLPEINPKIIRSLYPPDRIRFQRDIYEEVIKSYSRNNLLVTEQNVRSFLFSILFYLSKSGLVGIINRLPTIEKLVVIYSLGLPLLFLTLRLIYKLKISTHIKPVYSSLPEFAFTMASIGGTAIGMSIIYLTLFQFTYGSMTTYIGILSSFFMLGITVSPLMYNRIVSIHSSYKKIILIILALTSVLWLLHTLSTFRSLSIIQYLVSLFTCGFLSGLITSIVLENLQNNTTLYISTHLEIWDHIGACVGAIVFPLIIIPVASLSFSIFFILFLLTIALICYFLISPIKIAITPLWGRKIGYTLTGIFLCIICWYFVSKIQTLPIPEDEFSLVAKEMTKDETLSPTKKKLNNKEILFFEVKARDTNETVGYIFQTSTIFKVVGYSGEIDLAVRVNKEGIIENVKVINSEETPAYFSRVENYLFLYNGKNIFSPETVESVDIVSGATTSSEAVRRAIRFAGERFAYLIKENTLPSPILTEKFRATQNFSLYTLLAFTILSLFIRYKTNKTIRYLWLGLAVITLGIYFNIQLSTFHIITLINEKTYTNISFTTPFLLLAIPILIVPIFGNIYCGYLCPFGALSELLGDLTRINKYIFPSPKAWYFSRQLKYWILFIILTGYLLTSDIKILNADPLITFFNLDYSSLPFIIGTIALLLSILYNRFWCRVVCPTGAFLSILQSIKLLKKLWQKTLPSKCDLGIRYKEEIDCIQCNRCYNNEKI